MGWDGRQRQGKARDRLAKASLENVKVKDEISSSRLIQTSAGNMRTCTYPTANIRQTRVQSPDASTEDGAQPPRGEVR